MKIGDVCLLASVASETVLGVDNAKSGICVTVYGKRGHFTQKLKLRYRLQK